MIDSILKIQNGEQRKRSRQKPVKILIPVNLRKLFPSETLRNFVLYITPGVDPKMGEYTFEEIVKSIHHQMGMELTDKQLATKITKNVRSEKAFILKIMPLFVKNMAMKLAYNMVGEKKSCMTISNLGVVSMPAEMEKYVNVGTSYSVCKPETHNIAASFPTAVKFISILREILWNPRWKACFLQSLSKWESMSR